MAYRLRSDHTFDTELDNQAAHHWYRYLAPWWCKPWTTGA
jgi:hypothetical protein